MRLAVGVKKQLTEKTMREAIEGISGAIVLFVLLYAGLWLTP
jgi:hypothetical protein